MRLIALLASYLIVSCLLVLGACTSGRQPELARPTASIAPSGAVDPGSAAPSSLTCDGDPRVMMLDYGGDRTFTELLTTWAKQLGRPWVDRSRRTIWFLREDGTAHTLLRWTRVAHADNGRVRFVDGYEQCSDHRRWRHVASPATSVELEVGHCWVEPVTVEGRTWDVTREDQFGTGGPIPRGLVVGRPSADGTSALMGKVTFAGDVAVYVDASSTHLTLVPAGGRWAVPQRQRLCD